MKTTLCRVSWLVLGALFLGWGLWNGVYRYVTKYSQVADGEALRPPLDDLYFDMLVHGGDVGVVNRSARNASTPLTCISDQHFTLPVGVWNESSYPLVSSQEERRTRGQGVNLSSRFFVPSKKAVAAKKASQAALPEPIDGERLLFNPSLPAGINRKAAQAYSLPVRCPSKPGPYLLRVELVQEGVAWLSDGQGVGQGKDRWFELAVQAVASNDLASIEVKSPYFAADDPVSYLQGLGAGQEFDLKLAFKVASNLLKISGEIASVEGRSYLIANAGSQYPMVWSRDMATIQEAFFYLRPTPELAANHWSELFFPYQGADGSLPDWVATSQPVMGKMAAKNTVQSDQELWLVYGALRALAVGGLPGVWLGRVQGGLSHGERLQRALSWVLKERWAKPQGCVWTGHIADWGDVGPDGDSGATSTLISSGKPYVCGVFAQSLLYLVASTIREHPMPEVRAWLLSARGQEFAAAAGAAQDYAQKRLWLEKEGYFAIHRHRDGSSHGELFREDGIFALGGNLLAITSGLASEAQKKAITAHLEASTSPDRDIGTVLIPPYPSGFFADPIMEVAYTYQNGGSWDWFGAAAAAMIAHNNRQSGAAHLVSLARKVLRHGTFYEWTYPDGRPGAGPHFRAGAAAFLTGFMGIFSQPAALTGGEQANVTRLLPARD